MAPTASYASANRDAAALEALIAAARPLPPSGPSLADLVAAMQPGWVLLEGTAPNMPEHLLLHPQYGVVLLARMPGDVAPEAAATLREVLGPGSPPLLLLCLPQRMMSGLEPALEQGFAGLPPPKGSAWCPALVRLILDRGLARHVTLPGPPSPPSRGWLKAVLLVAFVAAGLVAAQVRLPGVGAVPPALLAPTGQPPLPASPAVETLGALPSPAWPPEPMAAPPLDYAEWPPDPAPPDDGAGPVPFRPG